MFKNIEKLIEEKNYSKIKQILSGMNEYDISEILEELPQKELIRLFRLLPKDTSADVFSYLETDTQASIISLLSEKEAVDIINDMAADDATDLLEEMPANVVNKLLNKVDAETRTNINHLLKYPENSAGSIMTVEYLDFKEYNTISDAVKKLKKEYNETETLDTCFVTDKRKKLIGTIKLKDLVINNDETPLNEIMDTDIHKVNTLMDQEEVANIIKDYDLTTVPVVDLEERLVGIITIDDIIDIMEEETTEDVELMAGILPTEKSYFKLSIFELYKSRIPWLILLMLSSAFTGKIIQSYEAQLATMAILTSFIPMIMGTSGNAGGQASATIIRGLSLNEVEFKDIFKVMFKETRVSILVGITLAVINFAKLVLIDKLTLLVSLSISVTLIVTVCIGKIVGCSLPIFAKKMGFDPAVMASPFITAIIDAVSLFIFFQICCMLLGL